MFQCATSANIATTFASAGRAPFAVVACMLAMPIAGGKLASLQSTRGRTAVAMCTRADRTSNDYSLRALISDCSDYVQIKRIGHFLPKPTLHVYPEIILASTLYLIQFAVQIVKGIIYMTTSVHFQTPLSVFA